MAATFISNLALTSTTSTTSGTTREDPTRGLRERCDHHGNMTFKGLKGILYNMEMACDFWTAVEKHRWRQESWTAAHRQERLLTLETIIDEYSGTVRLEVSVYDTLCVLPELKPRQTRGHLGCYRERERTTRGIAAGVHIS
jgi:hypothetical protein